MFVLKLKLSIDQKESTVLLKTVLKFMSLCVIFFLLIHHELMHHMQGVTHTSSCQNELVIKRKSLISQGNLDTVKNKNIKPAVTDRFELDLLCFLTY